jgi:RimJ/RimL family protein N-acetyltransferase/8-oxo-dGTP pyrophosphatase MutT (NUDIX family)
VEAEGGGRSAGKEAGPPDAQPTDAQPTDVQPTDVQPTLTDGTITLRPWRDDDIPDAIAGHDELIAHWFGFPQVTPSRDQQESAVRRWRTGYRDGRTVASFVIEHQGMVAGCCEVQRPAAGASTGELSWALFSGHRGQGLATRAVRAVCDWALAGDDQGGLGLSRIEAKVEPGNHDSLRVATRSGLRREGVQRVAPGTGDRVETSEYVVFARLVTDPPLTDPEGFRALLNSFLPRKRVISQMLIRDSRDRVLLCELTYKADWDLPGGVVEVDESPHEAATREVAEELSLSIPTGMLLLADWLPAWSGWDDALCLVFDGGRHSPDLAATAVCQVREIRSAEFCTLDQVAERARDYTTRRITAALAGVADQRPTYTHSGRDPSHRE